MILRACRAALLCSLVAALAAGCAPVREEIGEGDGSAGGLTGVFAWYSYGYYQSNYVIATILDMREPVEECPPQDYSYQLFDDDGDYLTARLFHGNSIDWEGTYHSTYDSGGPCAYPQLNYEDYPTMQCMSTLQEVVEGVAGYNASNSTLEITSYGEDRLRVRVNLGDDRTENFQALNCGERQGYVVIGRNAQEDGVGGAPRGPVEPADAQTAPAGQGAAPASAAGDDARPKPGRWQLRFR